jgi:xylulokinase
MFREHLSGICIQNRGARSTASYPSSHLAALLGLSWRYFQFRPSFTPNFFSLDDKLFSFWLLQGDSHPLSHVKGIFRFETGVKVNEFRDLRANPRCLVESQVLSFRVRWARMTSTGALGAAVGRARGNSSLVTSNTAASPSPGQRTGTPAIGPLGALSSGLGLTFDPYDSSSLPGRILATGAAINFPAVASLVSELFNAPVFVPTTQLDSAQITPHRNAPAKGYPGRAALGGAYVARWVWGKERGTGRGSFEEEVRRLLSKRWVASGGMPIRTHIGGETPAGSGANTPYGNRRTGFGAAVLEEEEEDALEELERLSGDAFGERELAARLRTATGSSTATTTTGTSTTSSSGALPSSTFTTPDLGSTSTGPTGEAGASASSASLMPVTALPTSEGEAQMGLAKVAEPDVDAFMAYAAIVPEYCRLEGMLVKALV